MDRRSVRLGLSALCCLIPLAHAAAQGSGDSWYGRQAKPKDFAQPMTFPGMFSIELPKNWQFAPGHTRTIFSIVEKTRSFTTGGHITMEYFQLQAPLDPALMPAASERELKETRDRELTGKGFTSEVKEGTAGPFIIIHYSRPGLWGSDDRVVRFSMPIGTTMYRLICIAPAASIEKYRTVFAHVAASFTPVPPGSK